MNSVLRGLIRQLLNQISYAATFYPGLDSLAFFPAKIWEFPSNRSSNTYFLILRDTTNGKKKNQQSIQLPKIESASNWLRVV